MLKILATTSSLAGKREGRGGERERGGERKGKEDLKKLNMLIY